MPGSDDDDDDEAVVLTVVATSPSYCSRLCVCEPSITTSGSSSAGLEENIGRAADADGLALLLLFWAMALVGEELSG